MRVIDPGHHYVLESYDGARECCLVFMKREGPGYPGNVGIHPGTNIQEVLRVLIDRLMYLQQQVPCEENRILLAHWREDLMLLEHRAARRHGRVLDLKQLPRAIELALTCPICGHVQCDKRGHYALMKTPGVGV